MNLSLKIVIINFAILLGLIGISVWLVQAFHLQLPILIEEGHILYIIAAVVALALVINTLCINRILVQRLKALNNATQKVTKGDYDVSLPMANNDEIGQLVENYKIMTNALHSNEYLSKNFVANVSHEFKTPISSIRGYAWLLQNEPNKKDIFNYTDIIIKEADRLSNMSADMLELCRIDSTEIISKSPDIKISEQIRQIVILMQPMIEDKNLNIDLSLDESTITTNSDLTYVIWLNLISNAIKYSTKDSTIYISLNIDDTLRFVISNTGDTLTDDNVEHIFDIFYTVDQSHHSEGSGIGLCIVKKAISKLDGNIDVSSLEGNTTFSVKMPTL